MFSQTRISPCCRNTGSFSLNRSPKLRLSLFHLLKPNLLPSPILQAGSESTLLPTPHYCIPQISPAPAACYISCVHLLLWYLCLASPSPSPQATLCICHPLLILPKLHSLLSRLPQLWHLLLSGGTPCTLTAERTATRSEPAELGPHSKNTHRLSVLFRGRHAAYQPDCLNTVVCGPQQKREPQATDNTA